MNGCFSGRVGAGHGVWGEKCEKGEGGSLKQGLLAVSFSAGDDEANGFGNKPIGKRNS